MKKPIYQSVTHPEMFAVRLYHDINDRLDANRFVTIDTRKDDVKWWIRESKDLMEDTDYYRVVGEIDLDGVVLEAIKRAVNENTKEPNPLAQAD